jgi:hypothetical protein
VVVIGPSLADGTDARSSGSGPLTRIVRMDPVFPRPLVPGDLVGVTSPSSGVPEELRPRLEVALASVRDAGLEVEVGACMDGAGLGSAAEG